MTSRGCTTTTLTAVSSSTLDQKGPLTHSYFEISRFSDLTISGDFQARGSVSLLLDTMREVISLHLVS